MTVSRRFPMVASIIEPAPPRVSLWTSCPRRSLRPTSRLDEGAIVDLPVEPVAVAGNVLLRCYVEVRLEQRNAWHLVISLRDKTFDVRRVFILVADGGRSPRALDERIHVLVDVAWRVEDGVRAGIAPEEEVLRI